MLITFKWNFQIYSSKSKDMVKYDKYYCKKLTEDTIISQGIYNQPQPNLQGQRHCAPMIRIRILFIYSPRQLSGEPLSYPNMMLLSSAPSNDKNFNLGQISQP